MTTKLPRKTMSTSKRLVGQAKGPTLGVKGQADDFADADAEETEEVIPANAFTTTQLVIGVLGMAAIILGVVIVTALLFDESDESSYSMLPDGYRQAVGLDAEEEQAILADILGEDEPTRSPFPEPQGRDPIILEVDCPDGTVQIATGSRPVDTVCIRGRVVYDDEPEPTETVSPTIVIVPRGATIGGQPVPVDLECQEDEVIGYVGIPDTLVCVHADNVGSREQGTAPPPSAPVPPASLPATGYGR